LKKYIYTILFWGIILQIADAQVNPNIDSLFFAAQDSAFNKSYQNAIKMCDKILKLKPNYYDAAVLKSRIYSWTKDYNKAIEGLKNILGKKPEYSDAILAMINVQKWSKNYKEALRYANLGLSYHYNNEDFILQKAEVLNLLKYKERANDILITFLKEKPKHAKANQLLKRINGKGELPNKINLVHSLEYFNLPWERNWHITSIQYSRKTKFGSIIPKINLGQLLSNENSFLESPQFQYEIDLYPKIRRGTYAYISYGFSPDKYFPKHRGGIEIYQGLPKSFEFSIGARWMQFSSNNNVYIYTGAIGKYYKDFWLSFRSFITPKSEGTSQSYFLFSRMYFSSGEHYASVILGKGTSPDSPERNFGNEELFKLDAYSMKIEYQQAFPPFLIKLNAGYKFQEYSTDKFRDVYSAAIYLMYKF